MAIDAYDLRKAKDIVGTYAVAVHLTKGHTTTITLGWRANSTRDNAIKACIEFAKKEKPGFKVEQYLVEKVG